MGGNAIASVHLFQLYLLNRLIFGLDLLYVCGSLLTTKAHRGLKLKVMGQGQDVVGLISRTVL